MDWLVSDTSPEVERLLIEGYRRMSSVEKARRLRALTVAAQRLALARLRAQYGDRPERELRLRLASLWLPQDLMVAAFGWNPETEGY
jgi:hypothetical protein